MRARPTARWACRLAAGMIPFLAAGCGVAGGDANRVEAVVGKRGLMPGEFVKPRAAAFDPGGRLYVVDFRAQIQVFSPSGERLAGWKTPTHERGRPSGLAIDGRGRLLVADSHYHRILVYSPDGRLEETIAGDDGTGPLSGRFDYIADIAVDSAGCLYVAESQERERITKLSPDWEILKEWGGRGPEPGQFSRIRALAFDAKDRLYVADACNHRIQVFDAEGNLLRVIGEQGSGPGELDYPFDVAVAPDGSVLVCEYGNHRVQRFSPEGEPLGTWGGPGREVGALWNPWALAVDATGRVCVVDSNNHRLQFVRF